MGKTTTGWYKANIDGATRGQPGMSSCGGLFRICQGFAAGSFVMPLGIQTAMYAEIMGLIKAVELAHLKSWFPLWIETDSKSLVHKVVKK